MDQTSLEFLYPLPSFLLVHNPPFDATNDATTESDSEQSSKEISMNDERQLIENVRNYNVEGENTTKQKEYENSSESCFVSVYNKSCDKRYQIPTKEEVISPNENGFAPTPINNDKQSCKVLIKTVYCE